MNTEGGGAQGGAQRTHLLRDNVGGRGERLDDLRRHGRLALAYVVLAEEELAVEVADLNRVQIDLCDVK